jgi:hypothetical protein
VEPAELGAPYDAIIASFSLTMMDMAAALTKMHATCKGTVHLFWFLTQPYTALLNMALWPKVHGSEFPGEPTADCLWEVLYEMGIYANLAVEARCEPAYYPTTESTAKDFSKRLDCTTPEQERAVREYCETSLVKTTGGHRVAGDALGAHLWWDVRTA